MTVFQQREISPGAALELSSLLDAAEGVLRLEQRRIQRDLDREEPNQHLAFAGLPEALRWRVMVLGASVEDINLWVRETEGGEYEATEIETGVAGPVGATPLEACENYFRQ